MEPTLHSGINSVVLLMAAGHEFETSIELRKIGLNIKSNIEITNIIIYKYLLIFLFMPIYTI